MNEAWEVGEWLRFGVLTTLKATLVLVAGWGMAKASRRRAAAERHLILLSAIVGVLLLPLLSMGPAKWPVAVALPGWTVETMSVSGTTISGGFSGYERATREGPGLPERAAGPDTERSGDEAKLAGLELAAVGDFQTPTRLWPAVLALSIWLTGTLLIVLWTLLSHARAHVISRRALRITDGPLVEKCVRIGGELGIRRHVRILLGQAQEMPKTAGSLRPWILLPGDAVDWPATRQESVIRHELAHVRRYDTLTELVAKVACAVYWFHPLIWRVATRLRAERENACDDIVILSGTRPSDYATDLLAVARSLQGVRAIETAAIAMARPSRLRTRLSAVLDDRVRAGNLRARRLLPASVAGLAILALLGATRPVAPTTSPLAPDSPPVPVEPTASVLPRAIDGGRPEEARHEDPAPALLAGTAPDVEVPRKGEETGPNRLPQPVGESRAGTSFAPLPYPAPTATAEIVREMSQGTDWIAVTDYSATRAAPRVTYTIEARLLETEGIAGRLPVEILAAIQEDGHLATLQMGTRGGSAAEGSFHATFTFPELADFQAWYATRTTQLLHRAIEAAAAGGAEVDLSVNRSPSGDRYGVF